MGMIDFTENTPHEMAELICLNCHSRAIHIYPEKTLLKDLQCKCGATGLLIKTGQTLHTSLTDLCNKCKLCVENSCKIHIAPVDDYCGYFSEVEDNGNAVYEIYDENYPCYSCEKYYECHHESLFPITYPDPENIRRISQYGCAKLAEYEKNIDKIKE